MGTTLGYFSPQPLHEYDAISADLSMAESALLWTRSTAGKDGGANIHPYGERKNAVPEWAIARVHIFFIRNSVTRKRRNQMIHFVIGRASGS